MHAPVGKTPVTNESAPAPVIGVVTTSVKVSFLLWIDCHPASCRVLGSHIVIPLAVTEW